jgi:FkbM family methyltransferase
MGAVDQVRAYDTWDWSKFKGDPVALKWNRKDVGSIDAVYRHIREANVCVQGGGNLGIFPKYLSCLFKTVYTFEPDQELFQCMTRNAPERNIIRFQAAMGHDRNLVGMSHVRRDGKPDNHAGITHVSGTGVIPTLRVDDLNLPVCNLLYLDLEGYEPLAIEGAKQTIGRCRPVICCEINKNAAFMGTTKDATRELICALGYRMAFRIKSDEVFLPC